MVNQPSGTSGGGTFAAHASEIEFVFGVPAPYLGPAEAALAAKVSEYWYTFAMSKDGDPNPAAGPAVAWPKYTAGLLS